MKKILFSVAILAVAASCAKTEVVDVPQTNSIGFSTLNDRATKAANDATDDYQVYALTSVGTGWLIDDVVYGAGDNANTAENGPYYWPTDADETVNFYAYAPAAAVVTSPATAYDADVTFNYAVPADAQEDFTVATPLTGYTSETEGGFADFTFNHMLTKVTVNVILASSGTYDLSNYTLEDTWTAAVSAFQTTSAVNVTTGISTPNTTADLSLTEYTGERVYYITPQATENCVIQLQNIQIKHSESGSYLYGSADTEPVYETDSETGATVTDDDGNPVVETEGVLGGVNLKAIVLGEEAMNTGDFEQGKHYVITVTVGGNATTEDDDTPVIIEFSADNASWDDDDTATGLIQG